MNWLLNHQGPDGAFFDVATTAEVIIALARVSGVAEGIADHCEVRPGAGETTFILSLSLSLCPLGQKPRFTWFFFYPKRLVTDKDNVGTAVIIPHPSSSSSAVDTNNRRNPASVEDNVSEPAVTDDELQQHHSRPAAAPQASSAADGNTNVTVSYSLWIGSNITEKRSINITADHNVTFYEIMQRAAEVDNAFTYVHHALLRTR